MIRRVLRSDYGLSLSAKMYTIVIGVVSSALLTRYLGLSLRGEYAFVVQLANIVSLVSDMGLSQTYTYFFRKYQGKVLGPFLSLYFRQFMLYLLIAGIVLFVTKGTAYAYVAMIVPVGVFRMRVESAMTVEKIRLSIVLHMWSITASAVGFGALLLLRDVLGRDLIYPVAVSVLVNGVCVFVYARLLHGSVTPVQQDGGIAREAIRFSWLPMLSILLVTMNYSVDVVLLRFMGTQTDLSLYAVAAGIMAYIWFIPDAFKEVLASRVARSRDTTSVNLAMKASVAAVVFTVLLFVLLGRQLLGLLYGSEFEAAYGVTLVLLLGVVSMVFYKIVGVSFLAEGRRGFYFTTLVASVTVNVVVNVLAIPAWGMYGAAVASVASYGLCGGAFLVSYLRMNELRFADAVFLTRGEFRLLATRIAGRISGN